jgi:RNA polymerase primary sigma factor
MVELLSHWKRATASLSQKLGREPSLEEIGKYLDLSPHKVSIVRQALGASAPPGRSGDGDDNFDLEDILAGVPSREPEPGFLGDHDREALRRALEFALTERERHIIELRYGLAAAEAGAPSQPCTLENIGDRIGLTRERVRQIENQGLRKLQIYLQEKDENDERARQERRRARVLAAASGPAQAKRKVPDSPAQEQPRAARSGRKTTVRIPRAPG